MTETEVVAESNGQETNKDNTDQETEQESAIIRQVEYYFGDLNLPRDKFLREQVKLDDGWVPLDILLKFNRLAKLSTDFDLIIGALNKSTSGLLEISDDKTKIRRSPDVPLPEMNEERRKDLLNRTIYAKGFPKDSVLDPLLKYFNTFEGVENLIMRKYQDKITKKKMFKGSVFVTFKNREQAEKFLNTKDVKYEDKELLVRWQEDYNREKQEEYNARRDKKDKKSDSATMKIKQEEKNELKFPVGTILQFTQSAVEDKKMSRESIKDALTAIGAEVAYIDYKIGDTSGSVRLAKENTAKDVFEKMTDGKIKIGEIELTFNLLEDEEEKAFLENLAQNMMKKRKIQKTHSRQNKGKNFRGKQGWKRKQEPHGDEPKSKIKVEDS